MTAAEIESTEIGVATTASTVAVAGIWNTGTTNTEIVAEEGGVVRLDSKLSGNHKAAHAGRQRNFLQKYSRIALEAT